MKSSGKLKQLHDSLQVPEWPGFGVREAITMELWVSVAEEVMAALPEIIEVVKAAEEVAAGGHDAFSAQRIVEIEILRLDQALR